MSNTLFAFLKKLNVPSQNALQASIDALGFDLKIDPDMKLLVDTRRTRVRLLPFSDL